jgi:hypothetical protein
MSEASGLTRDDIQLLAEIRELYDEIDPMPPEVVAAAKASLVWRDVDAIVAEIIEDTALTGTTGVRSAPGGPRLVTFEAEQLTVEVEVTASGDHRRVLGQLVPPASATVTVRWPDGSRSAEADELGRFAVEGVPSGPVSIVCAAPDTAPVATSWLTI